MKNLDDDLNKISLSETEPVPLVEDNETGDRFLVYGTGNDVKVELRYQGDTLWLSQAQMAAMFDRDRSVIVKHIQNIFTERELGEERNVQKMHKSTKPENIYSLDVIISVGYRVNSKQGTMFRIWATDKLVQFATKGFVVDVERLKNTDDFDRIAELKEIIADIRASEANVYREVRSICAMCQDYDPSSQDSRDFYAMMQNKLLYAVTSHTAPEIVLDRADAKQENMGLTNWPRDNIRKSDIGIAHNYLADGEIKEKNRFTVMLLDYFSDQLDIGQLVRTSQAETKLDGFIKFNNRALLRHKGKTSRSIADLHAEKQYEVFKEKRRALRQENP